MKSLAIKKETGLKIVIGILIATNLWAGIAIIQNHQTKRKLVKAYEMKLTQNIEEQLQLVTKTFVWSIRSEMMRDNYDQMGIYFNQLVKEEGKVAEISAVDKTGKIVVSTNKRLEEKAFETVYPKEYLLNDDVQIIQEGEQFRVIAPIMALNNKIGTLFMVYEPTNDMLQINTAQSKTDTLKNGQLTEKTLK